MRVVIQRVKKASVVIDEITKASINKGFLIFLGIEENDNLNDIDWLVRKIVQLRIFEDDLGKMNLDIQQAKGEILVVSQFTLHAATSRGNRPSFVRAAAPEISLPLYESFISELRLFTNIKTECGEFGSNMSITIENYGPVTILMDSKNRE